MAQMRRQAVMNWRQVKVVAARQTVMKIQYCWIAQYLKMHWHHPIIPGGVTAGVIETDEEGKCIFLTPNTAVSFSDIGLDEVAFAYRIHPWVQADSDGAGLDVMLYRKDGEELFWEEIAVEADNAWMEYELDLRDYADISELRVSCNNGGHNDDVCDWVVIKYVDNLHP